MDGRACLFFFSNLILQFNLFTQVGMTLVAGCIHTK